MEKKTFRQLVAELMMDVEKYGDLIVTDYKIIADYDEDTDAEWSYEADADEVEADECHNEEYYNEDMGFDPYMGCYTGEC